jgi:thioredoxin-like negative regulator of GroEL
MNKKILYFTGVWCKPCQILGPVMSSLSNQINYEKVDVDSEPFLVSKYNVRSVPTLILLANGQEIKRMSGVRQSQEILNFYNNV